MDKNNRPQSRKKKVASGTASVQKRGDGVDLKGKPVGRQDGYTDRKSKTTKAAPASSGAQGQDDDRSLAGDLVSGLGGQLVSGLIGSLSSPASGSGKKASGKSSLLKKVLIIAAVVIVGYFIITALFPQGGDPVSGYPSQPVSSPSSGQTAPLNTVVSSGANPKRTVIKGGGEDVVTVMIYMCGTDLESQYGMATADLKEMTAATIGSKVNIIVETGGTNSWRTQGISNSTNQRWRVTGRGLELLQDNLGARAMTDPATLSDFIRYCTGSFPANRYALIFWDHGGGSISGYGYDQKFPSTSMTLDKIDTALKDGGCAFDFVGFDACLMATLENALMLSDYADYMIASEETEPGIGWYYTDWLTRLSANTSMSTVEIGRGIIDDFVEQCAAATPNDKTTLSIVDLAELSGTAPSVFRAFASSTGELVDSDSYRTVADARGASREFGQTAQIDQIDLIHFAQNLGTGEAAALADVLKQSIKYNRTGRTISNAYGIAIYFPYARLSGVGTMLSTYDKIGMDEAYSRCVKSFANLETGGQIVSSGSSSPLSALFGGGGGSTGSDLISGLLGSFIQGGDFSAFTGRSVPEGGDWIDTAQMTRAVEYYEQHYIDSSRIVLTQKRGDTVLALTEQEWDLIQGIALNVFVDDGGGYIDLGLDNVFEFNGDGDLLIDFDGTWLTINGHVVSYYFLSEDTAGGGSVITGRVPALLNGQAVDLIVVFDDAHPGGVVAGARILYGDETDTVARGLIEISDGDKIDFLCDYYTYGEEFVGSYLLGDTLVVEGGLTVRNMSIGGEACKVTYLLTDIYRNTYWTPAVDG